MYYGTDTRAAGLLCGAALAYVWKPAVDYFKRAPNWVFDIAGLAGLAGLAFACALINQFAPFLYRGGFLVVAGCTVALLAASVHPRANRLQQLMGWPPLRWVGLRSYGIYLWHWPVCMVTRPQLDVPFTGISLLVVRLALTLILAELSYRFVETPIRNGSLERSWRTLHEAGGLQQRRLRARWIGAGTAFLIFSIVVGQSVVRRNRPRLPRTWPSNQLIPDL